MPILEMAFKEQDLESVGYLPPLKAIQDCLDLAVVRRRWFAVAQVGSKCPQLAQIAPTVAAHK